QKQKLTNELVEALHVNDQNQADLLGKELVEKDKEDQLLRKQLVTLMEKNNPEAQTNDGNYIFLYFVTHQLPVGVVGLLIAIIFLASMGSTASGLNSLASCTVVDFYKRIFHKDGDDKKYLGASRWATFAWGVFCVIVALYAGKVGNLIEVVN